MDFRQLAIGLFSACAVFLTGCATDRLHKEGLDAIEAGRYEEGITKLEQALAADSSNMTYRLDLQGRRTQAIAQLIDEGDRARTAGNIADARTAYSRVLQIDTGNSRAQRGLEQLTADQRHAESIALAKRDLQQGKLDSAEARLRAVLEEDPGSVTANAMRAQIDAARGPRSITPRLKTRDNRPVTLQFRDASTNMVFEALARQTGINFILDKDVKSDGKTTIFVDKVPIDQAIALILGQNGLAQQVLADNMVMIYPSTAAKQKDYQEQSVRTFYLTNMDPKKAMEMLKTMLNAKTLFVDERARAVVVRDTPDAIRMAERLIASTDVPEAEVMLEVEVLELTRSRLQQLGIKYPESVTLTPTPLAGEPLVLADLGDQDSTTIQVSDVSLTVDLRKEVSTGNLLASPRIRARNHEKAKILIGQRVPVITANTTPSYGGNVQTSSVQYVDVGLTLEVEPDIYQDGDVAIKVSLEVSNIVRQIRVGDTLAYQIGTRNASTLLRLRDGETQVLAGLIQDNDRTTSTHIPGLGDIPILGRLFGTRNDDGEKTEIVLSIKPRIVRSQSRASSDNIEFYFGTESAMRSAPLSSATAAATGPSASTTRRDATPSPPETVAPDTAGAMDAVATSAGTNGTGLATGTDTGDSSAPPARPTIRIDGPGQVAVGQEFEIALNLASAQPLGGITSILRFDPLVLQLVSGSSGPLVPPDRQDAGTPRPDVGPGRARFEVGSTSIVGDGTLFALRFKALQPRPQTLLTLQQFAATAQDGELVGVMAPRPLVLVVTP
jgi:general secretion pathway protein D